MFKKFLKSSTSEVHDSNNVRLLGVDSVRNNCSEDEVLKTLSEFNRLPGAAPSDYNDVRLGLAEECENHITETLSKTCGKYPNLSKSLSPEQGKTRNKTEDQSNTCAMYPDLSKTLSNEESKLLTKSEDLNTEDAVHLNLSKSSLAEEIKMRTKTEKLSNTCTMYPDLNESSSTEKGKMRGETENMNNTYTTHPSLSESTLAEVEKMQTKTEHLKTKCAIYPNLSKSPSAEEKKIQTDTGDLNSKGVIYPNLHELSLTEPGKLQTNTVDLNKKFAIHPKTTHSEFDVGNFANAGLSSDEEMLRIHRMTQDTLGGMKDLFHTQDEPGIEIVTKNIQETPDDLISLVQAFKAKKMTEKINQQQNKQIEELVSRIGYLEEDNAQLRAIVNQYHERFNALEKANLTLSTKLQEINTRVYGLAVGGAYSSANSQIPTSFCDVNNEPNELNCVLPNNCVNQVTPVTAFKSGQKEHNPQTNYKRSVSFSTEDFAKMSISGDYLDQTVLKATFLRLYLSTYSGPASAKCKISIRDGVMLNRKNEHIFAQGDCKLCNQKFKFRIRKLPTDGVSPVLEIRSTVGRNGNSGIQK